jgi:hypothetical protein
MSPHAILGVRADADPDEIRRRYRELAKVCHPDAGGDPASFIRLQQAFKQLLEEKSNPKLAAPAESATSWGGDVAEPLQQESHSDSRPKWWDEIVNDKSSVRPKEEKRRNPHVEKAVPDRSFLKLVGATLGAAVVVTLTSCVKGGAPDLASIVGQMIIFSTFLFVAAAVGAAVGAGSDEKSFISTYLGVLAFIAIALMVAVPLPFLKPA